MATSTIRRKPIHTYKSPSFDTTSDQLSYRKSLALQTCAQNSYCAQPSPARHPEPLPPRPTRTSLPRKAQR
ncbi:uncharacterized protein B0H18DRAFT_1012389 [Fomitopsis serialis]|uniref:uncharacterized protein n=1 Tax=Fomitopsis serialis TaxID=139415 RepID=UPI0020073BDC|nr:uncharacterized protein B0H18DRAFT_1046798 [Neoantrodia serialis]XP_047892515.1 uncharacterized protein B0H18DRAFT_1012389 [Neoantrodia serialis]KAH9914009.1 hypothetical protein B0H18DRAFT_1046798 [Neoantrodia serialis]KAH9924471.1 hypothetical protein B0H18DRAFT_1012389 [Neoantrodia serialis]